MTNANSKIKFLLISFGIFFLFPGCKAKEKQIHRAFYFWKTHFKISSNEKNRLEQLKIKKLYSRFFDVSLNASNEAVPVAKIDIDTASLKGLEIIPVVFITNKTLEQVAVDKIETLAANIVSLVDKTAQLHKINYHELQIDCDWSLRTKNNFFNLLELIKKKVKDKAVILSCTIRLHQVKYFKKTGMPPVDRGLLMFYNMGKLEDTLSNSIFNSADAVKYTASIKNYRLPLDIALPVFSWVKHYREDHLIGLINDFNEAELKENPAFAPGFPHHFRSLKNMFLHGEYIEEGDLLVEEEITPSLAMKAAELLAENFYADNFTIVLYHWDASNLSRYENEDIENIFRCFK